MNLVLMSNSTKTARRQDLNWCAVLLCAFTFIANPVSVSLSFAQQQAAQPEAATSAPAVAPPASVVATPDAAAATPVSVDPEPVLPHDLSPVGMFLAADRIVKAVMLGLAFASVVTWTVWIAKALEMLGARRAVLRDIRVLRETDSLREANEQFRGIKGDVAELVKAAVNELRRSQNAMNHEGVKERVASLFSRIEAGASQRMTRGTSILATIGSTGPFVGLFGTVWGIMNSFIGISKSQTTNLAVVAPGIAEALLATALGLVAAIPAVVIYNMFARSITGYRSLLSDASAELMRMVSRDLDRLDFLPHRRAAE
jgi:biopolymer transport protein ExbB